MAAIQPGDVVLDPLCGGGSISIEVSQFSTFRYAVVSNVVSRTVIQMEPPIKDPPRKRQPLNRGQSGSQDVLYSEVPLYTI